MKLFFERTLETNTIEHDLVRPGLKLHLTLIWMMDVMISFNSSLCLSPSRELEFTEVNPCLKMLT